MRLPENSTTEDILVFDVHQHLGTSWLGRNDISDIGPKELVADLDKFNVDRACISSAHILYDIRRGNDEIIAACKQYPDRLVPLMVVSPRQEWAPEEVDRCVEMGMKGIKLHPFVGAWRASSRLVDAIMKKALQHGLPVKIHSGADEFSNPREIGQLAARFPQVRIILAHMGGSYWLDAIEVAKENKNILLDTADSVNEYIVLETAVREVGAQRILFGSDAPELNLAAELAKVVHGHIPVDAKCQILGKNAMSLFNLQCTKGGERRKTG